MGGWQREIGRGSIVRIAMGGRCAEDNSLQRVQAGGRRREDRRPKHKQPPPTRRDS